MATRSLLPDDDRPLHARIKEWLLQQLQGYKLEDQLPSDRELAKLLGASYLTVNKVMVELEREGYVVRRPGRGTFLASRERTVASDAESGKRGLIVFAYPRYFSFGFWERARLAEETAVKNGMGFVEFRMNRDTTYISLIDFVGGLERVRGVFVLASPGSVTQDVAMQLDTIGVPVVVCGACDWTEPPANLYQVGPDAFKRGSLMVSYLAERGHTRIGYVHNEPDGPESTLLWRGMRQAIREHSLALKDLVRPTTTTHAWQDSTEAGRQMTAELLDAGSLTALICDSEGGAAGAMRTLWDRSVRVPEDISIVAPAGGRGHEEYMTPPLTAIDHDLSAEISAGFDIITGDLRPGDHTMFIDVRVVERASVSSPVRT